MPESHTILGGKVHVYRRDKSSRWQCATYLAGKPGFTALEITRFDHYPADDPEQESALDEIRALFQKAGKRVVL